MSPLNDFEKYYIEKTKEHKQPINALNMAITNYLKIREKWLKGSVGLYGWRGAISKGKLFMNRSKTKANIEVMKEILVLLNDESIDYQIRLKRIRALKVKLSRGGQGRKLIDIFLETAVSDNCAYIPSKSSLEESVYVARQTVYRRKQVLGKGAFGSAERFVSEHEGRSVVVKQIHNPYTSAEEIEGEIALFKAVYDLLGRPYFGDDIDACVIKAPTESSIEGKVLLPEVPGGSLETFCRDNPDCDHEALFFSVFNFLFRMHSELGIAHRDCHIGNVMVVDQLYNVFFIDYGMACSNDGSPIFPKGALSEFVKGAREDVALCICDYFFVKKIKGITEDLKVKDIIAQFELDRWDGFIFTEKGSDDDDLENYLVKKVNYFNRLVGVKAKLKK